MPRQWEKSFIVDAIRFAVNPSHNPLPGAVLDDTITSSEAVGIVGNRVVACPARAFAQQTSPPPPFFAPEGIRRDQLQRSSFDFVKLPPFTPKYFTNHLPVDAILIHVGNLHDVTARRSRELADQAPVEVDPGVLLEDHRDMFERSGDQTNVTAQSRYREWGLPVHLNVLEVGMGRGDRPTDNAPPLTNRAAHHCLSRRAPGIDDLTSSPRLIPYNVDDSYERRRNFSYQWLSFLPIQSAEGQFRGEG